MKIIKPKSFYLSRQVCWEKPNFCMYVSIYSGFDFFSEEWLPEKKLLKLIQNINGKYTIDNGKVRERGECLIFSDNQSSQKFELRIGDVYKNACKEKYLPLPVRDKEKIKSKGTFDKLWLNSRWPALPQDHKKDVFQIAPRDQQSENLWKWGEPFEIHTTDNHIFTNFPLKEIKLFSEGKPGSFKEIGLQPDVAWLFPDQQTGIIISHACLVVEDAEASNIDYLYVEDNQLEELVTLDEHYENYHKQILQKKPSFKPKLNSIKTNPSSIGLVGKPKIPEDIKSMKPSPEMQEFMNLAESKAADFESKHPEEIKKIRQNTDTKICPELQDILDEKDLNLMFDKLTSYTDKELALTHKRLTKICPDKADDILKQPTLSIDECINLVNKTVDEDIKKIKLKAPDADLSEVPDSKEISGNIVSALRSHEAQVDKLKLLDTQKHDINKYKGKDLSNHNLSNTDFTGCDLTNTNFSFADLTGSIFNKTKISETIFIGANLSQTSFLDLIIISSNFSDAILKKGEMKSISINQTYFNNSDLSMLSANDTQWRSCIFSNTKLRASKLLNCTISGGKDYEMNLDKSSLKNFIFQKVGISMLHLNLITGEKILLNECEISKATITESVIDGLQLNNSNLKDTSFELSTVSKLSITTSQLHNSNFNSANLSGIRSNYSTVFNHCYFKETDLSKARIIQSRFEGCEFYITAMRNGMFTKSFFENNRFNKVHAQMANFTGSSLKASYFEKSNLLYAKFRMCKVESVTFINSNLYGIKLYLARIQDTEFQNNLYKENFELLKEVQTIEGD